MYHYTTNLDFKELNVIYDNNILLTHIQNIHAIIKSKYPHLHFCVRNTFQGMCLSIRIKNKKDAKFRYLEFFFKGNIMKTCYFLNDNIIFKKEKLDSQRYTELAIKCAKQFHDEWS
jgi:hypothetical protein